MEITLDTKTKMPLDALSLHNLSILHSLEQQYTNRSGKIKIIFAVFKENLSGYH